MSLRSSNLLRSAVAALVFAGTAFACSDDVLKSPPGALDPTGSGDGGSATEVDAEVPTEWGDPKTTRRPNLLRLGQLNVRRYFDSTCDSNNCSSGGFEEVLGEEQFNAKTADLAEGILSLQADVVTLAEIENQATLDALQAKLKEHGADYPVAHLAETGDPGSIDVAVLARGKLDKVVTHRQETRPLKRPDGSNTIFTRELPEVYLTLGGKKAIVFAAHFRSKAGEDDPGRRLAEAQKTQEVMAAAGTANPDVLVLLGGDLNDTPGSPPIDALEKGDVLLRVASDLSPDAQGTYVFSGQQQAIDHIFTARAAAYVARSAKVVREGSRGLGGSDHAGIYADFTFD